jgi:DNA phosphorothioation-dependent restriction protein DptG
MVLWCSMDSLNFLYKILSWNVRGMNCLAKQEDIKQIVGVFKPDLECLQETKMEQISQSIIRNALGTNFETNLFLPTNGTRGGILVATSDSIIQLANLALTNHSILASVNDVRTNSSWMIIGVYGSQGELEKRMFVRELKHLKQTAWPR